MQDKTYNINISKLQIWIGIIATIIAIATPIVVFATTVMKNQIQTEQNTKDINEIKQKYDNIDGKLTNIYNILINKK